MPEKLVESQVDVLPIAPALYQEVLERLTLQSICLDRTHASCRREGFGDSGIDISVSADGDSRQTEDEYLTFVTYQLKGKREDTVSIEIDATYRISFTTDTAIPDGFFDVFREINLPMTTMPYFRELVASTMARMQLPPLTLPYMVFGAPGQEATGSEEVPVGKTSTGERKQKKG